MSNTIALRINENLWNSACPNPDEYIGQVATVVGKEQILFGGGVYRDFTRVRLASGEELSLYEHEFDRIEHERSKNETNNPRQNKT